MVLLPQFRDKASLIIAERLGRHDPDHNVLISPAVARPVRKAPILQPQLRTARGTRGQGDGHRPIERGDLDLGSERGLRNRYRHVHGYIAAVAREV